MIHSNIKLTKETYENIVNEKFNNIICATFITLFKNKNKMKIRLVSSRSEKKWKLLNLNVSGISILSPVFSLGKRYQWSVNVKINARDEGDLLRSQSDPGDPKKWWIRRKKNCMLYVHPFHRGGQHKNGFFFMFLATSISKSDVNKAQRSAERHSKQQHTIVSMKRAREHKHTRFSNFCEFIFILFTLCCPHAMFRYPSKLLYYFCTSNETYITNNITSSDWVEFLIFRIGKKNNINFVHDFFYKI